MCEATLKAASEAGCRFERLLSFKLRAKESMKGSGGIYRLEGVGSKSGGSIQRGGVISLFDELR